MLMTPGLKVDRFEQLEPGELFICPRLQGPCLALKAEDPERNGEKLVLPLSNIQRGGNEPRLYRPSPMTTISLGKDYTIKLPTTPDGWSVEDPDAEVFCLVIFHDVVFFRANFSFDPKVFNQCLVRASDGIVVCRGVPGIPAYALRWEIVIPDGSLPARSVLQHPEVRSA
jgi:hypothetical protein